MNIRYIRDYNNHIHAAVVMKDGKCAISVKNPADKAFDKEFAVRKALWKMNGKTEKLSITSDKHWVEVVPGWEVNINTLLDEAVKFLKSRTNHVSAANSD